MINPQKGDRIWIWQDGEPKEVKGMVVSVEPNGWNAWVNNHPYWIDREEVERGKVLIGYVSQKPIA